jgi:tellurite resistance protein TerB
MGFLDNLRSNSQQMSEQVKLKANQFKHKDFARAAMAICALIAAADGSIDASERQKMAGFISSNDTLQAFDIADLKTQFDHFAQKLQADYDFGKIEALQAIGKLKGKEDQARAIIQVGIIIGGADGSFDADEQRAVREACHAAGIDPAEFQL